MGATAIRSWCWGWRRYARSSRLGDTVYYCRKAASTSNTIQYRPVDWSSLGAGWRLTIAWRPVGRSPRQRAAPLPGCSAGKHRWHGSRSFFHLEEITAAAASAKRWASVSVTGQWECCCCCRCCRAGRRSDEICPLLRNRRCPLSSALDPCAAYCWLNGGSDHWGKMGCQADLVACIIVGANAGLEWMAHVQKNQQVHIFL